MIAVIAGIAVALSAAVCGVYGYKSYQDKKAEARRKEKQLQKAILQIQKKYGKNAVLKGTNLLEGATMKERNNQVGGHRA